MLRVVCARRSCSRPLFSSVLPRQCSRSLPIYCTSLPYLGFEFVFSSPETRSLSPNNRYTHLSTHPCALPHADASTVPSTVLNDLLPPDPIPLLFDVPIQLRLLSSSYGLRRASCCSHSLCSNPCCSHPTLPRAPRRPNSHTHTLQKRADSIPRNHRIHRPSTMLASTVVWPISSACASAAAFDWATLSSIAFCLLRLLM
jgi:hypothetical protein